MPLHRFTRRAGVLAISIAMGAAAAEPEHEAGSSSAHAEHYGEVISVKVAYIEVLDRGAAAEGAAEAAPAEHPLRRASAVGLGFEHALVPGWLNAQAGALIFFGLEGTELPSSLLLELPWEISESAEVYVGAGLAADLVHDRRFSPSFGLASSAGIYAWATPHLGANIDVEHRWLPSERSIYDLTLALGAAARF